MKSISISICFIIFFISNCFFAKTYAQGIYEVTYNLNYSNGITEYKALIFYYSKNSTNNVMRFRFYSKGEWKLVEEKFHISEFELHGKNYWVIHGDRSTNVDDTTVTYRTHNLFLTKSPSETYYVPDITVTKTANGNVYGKVTSFTKLNRDDISNAYLNDYKWKWNTPDDSFAASRIQLILVSNTNDSQLGDGFRVNHRKVKAFFKDIAKVCGVPINIIEITGENFSQPTLRKLVSDFLPSENDIVIFYYSGHGFHARMDNGSWPSLDLRQGFADGLAEENSMSLAKDIYQPLCNKKARLTMVFGECCNMYAGALFPIKDNTLLMAPSNMLNPAAVKKMFNKTGNFLIAGSDVNEPSYYGLGWGGSFCNNFISAFLQATGISSSSMRWKDIISSARLSTMKDTESEKKKQEPIYHYEVND
ncbi:hypothetical protein AAFN85_13630 [Mucilaginibacter sp. CAU 1740]|uniref:hypothetical protein n=1 Tax=Mucilaginibacter sp. CAU 1740 TaxID=3140365 RepID=UPI00325AF079